MKGLDRDIVALMKKRVMDIAGSTDKRCKVSPPPPARTWVAVVVQSHQVDGPIHCVFVVTPCTVRRGLVPGARYAQGVRSPLLARWRLCRPGVHRPCAAPVWERTSTDLGAPLDFNLTYPRFPLST